MCLILFAYNSHPDYSLILAANRDEYYRRPTRPLDFWSDAPDILAGRDLEAQGTWLGISRNGRLAGLTNLRGKSAPIADAPSRGDLVSGFLAGVETPMAYLERIQGIGHHFNGFNLIVGDSRHLYYYSNQGSTIHHFDPGVYGISTCQLGTQWPKIEKGKTGLADRIAGKSAPDPEDLFRILEDRTFPPDRDIPLTGLDRGWERTLSPLFIESDTYGTRSSSVILVAKTGMVTFAERTFKKGTAGSSAQETRRFEFEAEGLLSV
jgi:uncharacterized protein with NRDE domain